MLKLLSTDWAEYIFNLLSLKIYENEQGKRRRNKRTEKKRVLKNNRIIVKVNNDIIYDSKKEKDMPDDLYYALLSYGLKESINSKPNKKTPINYTLYHSISAVPVWNEDILVGDAI